MESTSRPRNQPPDGREFNLDGYVVQLLFYYQEQGWWSPVGLDILPPEAAMGLDSPMLFIYHLIIKIEAGGGQ